MRKLLFLLLLAMPAYGVGPYGFTDPLLNKEFEKNYYEHKYPKWVNATGSSLTITNITGNTSTFTGLLQTIRTGNIVHYKLSDSANGQSAFLGMYVGASLAGFMLGVNRDMHTGVFTKTGQTASDIEFFSGNGSGSFTVHVSSENNTAPGAVATFQATGVAIKGTTTNDSATSGYVGEAAVSVVSAVAAAATTQYKDITTISLSPGDWDVSCNMGIDGTGVTITGVWAGGISAGTAGNACSDCTYGSNNIQINPGAAAINVIVIPTWRVSIAATTTVRLKFQATYSAGTPSVYGRLSARRVR